MEVTSTKDGQRVYFLSGLPDPGILKCWAASDVTNWWDFPADRPTAAFRPFVFCSWKPIFLLFDRVRLRELHRIRQHFIRLVRRNLHASNSLRIFVFRVAVCSYWLSSLQTLIA